MNPTLQILKETPGKFAFDTHKLIYHMDRVDAHFNRGERIPPIHIDAAVTKCCDARCVYCYGLFQEMSSAMLPHEVVINLFKDAPKVGVKSLVLTGDGENILNSAIFPGLVFGHQGGLKMGLATNGISLTPEKIETIVNTCTWCRFNLSAADRTSYKNLHGVDKWAQVQANIKAMVQIKKRTKSNISIGLQMVLIPQAIEQVIPEAKFALRQGVDYFVIKQFSDPGDPRMSRFNLNWYDNAEVRATLRKAEAMSSSKTKIIPKWNIIALKGRRAYDHCVDCPLIFQISGDGKCYPCGYLFGNKDYCYGDLMHQSLGEIIASSRYWNIINHMRYDFDVHKDCKGSCRHDSMNRFVSEYLKPPMHIDFP